MASELVATTDSAKIDADWMRSISGQMSHLSTGDRAALRRMELTRSPAADGVVIKLLMQAKVPVTHVAAMLSGTGALPSHAESRSVGAALSEASYSENRVLRLLATRGEGLHDQVRRAARILAKARKPIDLWTVYHLVGDDEAKAEAARVRIAQDFYPAEARSVKGDDE
jgi:CRISPR system Cascade subunit CasB